MRGTLFHLRNLVYVAISSNHSICLVCFSGVVDIDAAWSVSRRKKTIRVSTFLK